MTFISKFFLGVRKSVCDLLFALTKIFWKDRTLVFFVYAGLLFSVFSWTLLYWLFVRNPSSGLILHYNAFLGIDIFLYDGEGASFFDVFLAPIGGACFFVVNVLLSMLLIAFVRKEGVAQIIEQKSGLNSTEVDFDKIYRFGGLLILGGNAIVQISIFVYTVAIVLVNM